MRPIDCSSNSARRVTVQPTGAQFDVLADESVLQAALRQKIALPHGCKNGICGACRLNLVSGEVSRESHELGVGNEFRTCIATALSDLTILMPNVSEVKNFNCEIQSKRLLATDVMLVRLRMLDETNFEFIPGQYISFLLSDETKRSFSIATASRERIFEFDIHVRRVPDGKFTNEIFHTIKPGDRFVFEGPIGNFRLANTPSKQTLFIASGTGFAPIKSIVDSMLDTNDGRAAALYWGGRRPQDLYMHEEAERWARLLPNFRFVPVLSEVTTLDRWRGRTGLVHRIAMHDFTDMSECDVYACGNPNMVTAAKLDFENECRLRPSNFLADAFTTRFEI